MFYGDDEAKKAHISKKIALMRSAAAVLPLLRTQLTKFDGKVYNKRFIESFETDTDKLIISAERRTFDDRDFVDIYAIIDRQYSQKQHVCRICLENKRIPAQHAITSASAFRTDLLQKAMELETYLEKIDEIRQYLDYLETKRKQIVKDIPYEIASVYNINKY